MKLSVLISKIGVRPEYFLRRAGYQFIHDKLTGKNSFVKSLQGQDYPRFHIYAENKGEEIVFDLHLDITKPNYSGSNAHNAEYDGETVKEEIERLKNLVQERKQANNSLKNRPTEEKKSWWQNFF